MEKIMRQMVGRNLLKYAVGRQMFCPTCDTMLDVKHTVEIDLRNKGEIVEVKVQCELCFQRIGKVAYADAFLRRKDVDQVEFLTWKVMR